ncbi:bifunctional DNA primase/polymerase [Actinacidiphila sp. ITFR-21]|uniref:bifunctional DNA primase/polymerase n=1 Tax=Actinacidiphila sp. ITFR-21 TaxID=3075199 RepID=UPI00288ADC7B|nr:bifunctional DNA primase/polymerase [Streptomyces sp. ITFR-21]WNI16940.1 bifunctional DNA primase/polymerase [Streptomyces sp. ITFR-21]
MADTPAAQKGALNWALWLAGQGFAVFKADHPTLPRCAGVGQFHDPATCTDRGKHPAVAFTYRNTKDQAEVRRQFGDGIFNVGIFVGGCQGPDGKQLVVMDSDRPRALEDVANALGHEHTPTMRVVTGKGHHDYYWAPADARLGNSLGALKGKFDGDVRAGNAYVIAAGSLHASGAVYTLEDAAQPPVDAPEWLLTALQDRGSAPARPVAGVTISADRYDKYTRNALQAECDAIVNAPEGNQNNQINASAFSIGTIVGAGGLGEGEAWEALLSAARGGNHPESRAISAINSGLHKGMSKPRHPWPPVSRRDDEAELRALIAPAPDDGQHVDWSDAEEGVPEPEGPPADTAPKPIPGRLPAAFYAARPELDHIRQAAHSRNRSADVAFYSTLARLSGIVPHHIRADTGIADYVSLNLFVAVVGGSGTGKSTGVRVGGRLITAPPEMDFRDGLPIGSGEGMAEIFMGTVEEETGEIHKSGPKKGDPVTVTVRAQVRHNAFFYVDEGATLTRLMKERTGSTLGETIRSAAVGQTLGQTNASKDNTRYIPGGSYSMGLLVGFQPETAAPLFQDTAEGTPQRFLWGVVTDPTIPDDAPYWPGELTAWRDAISLPGGSLIKAPTYITFDREITTELRRVDLANARGEKQPEGTGPLDSHAPVMKIKVSSLLAILAGRLHVTVEDWELAEMVWRASCAARDWVIAYSERQRQADQEKRTQARIVEEVRVDQARLEAEETRSDKGADRVATRLALLVHQGGPATRSALRTKFPGRDKKHIADGITLAMLRDWVIEADGKLCPGRSRPT